LCVEKGHEGAAVAVGRDRYEMAVLSAIDPRRIGLDAF
jgi:hypothetical protein